jgi:hypothetical protein
LNEGPACRLRRPDLPPKELEVETTSSNCLTERWRPCLTNPALSYPFRTAHSASQTPPSKLRRYEVLLVRLPRPMADICSERLYKKLHMPLEGASFVVCGIEDTGRWRCICETLHHLRRLAQRWLDDAQVFPTLPFELHSQGFVLTVKKAYWKWLSCPDDVASSWLRCMEDFAEVAARSYFRLFFARERQKLSTKYTSISGNRSRKSEQR